MVLMILFTSGKVATKWKIFRKIQSDDILMILAMLTAFGFCGAVAVQVHSGLGQPGNAFNSHQFDLYQKSAYASQFFYVSTLYTAKTAALQFLVLLARPNWPDSPDLRRFTVGATRIFIATWLVVAVLCISFQCAAPNPWDQASGRCFNQSAFWITNGVIDAITQLLIGLAPIYLLFNIHLSVAKKRLAFLSFTPNTMTIPLTLARLVYLYKAYHSSDTRIDAVNVALVTVIHTNLCIVASCVPFLRPVVVSLDTGLITSDIRAPVRSEKSIMGISKMNPFAILSGRKSFQRRNGWARFPASADYASTVTGGKNNDMELHFLDRYGSQDRMIINQTKTILVSSDPGEGCRIGQEQGVAPFPSIPARARMK
ncbi:MAG: hypothetical protein Q9175_007011 [Cornicularia normoerica]